jgi:predicted DNA-binding transcriptional regulator AlpA
MNWPNDLLSLLHQLPTGATVPVGWVVERLEAQEPEPVVDLEEHGWRARLWTVPEETRLTAQEVAEALGHSVGWVYKRTMATAEQRLPHRKTDAGGLVFLAGELREWLRAREAA